MKRDRRRSLPSSARGSVRSGRWVKALAGIGLTTAAAGTVLFILASTSVVELSPDARDVWLYSAVYAGAVLATGACAVRDRGARRAWILLAAGMVLYSAGNVCFSILAREGGPPSYPSWADVGYLGSYPLIYATLILLLAEMAGRRTGSQWLDGLIVTLTSAALIVAFLVGTLVEVTDQPLASLATDFAYVLGDVLLASTVLTGLWLLGRRCTLSWAIFGVAVLVCSFGDMVFLVLSAAADYVEGGLLDAVWLIAAALMAASAVAHGSPAETAATASPETPKVDARREAWLISVPLLGVLASLGLLLPWPGWECPVLARWFAGAVIGLAVARSALTFRELAVLELRAAHKLAATDELTGLINRRGFGARVQRLLPVRTAGDDTAAPVTLLMLDLDGFKEVNDSLGHQAGDQLLIGIAERLTAVCRGADDVVARLGGDEFAVLLPGTGRRRSKRVAQRIGEALAAPIMLEGVKVVVSASTGIAVAPHHGRTPEVLMRHADLAMYDAKQHRRGAVMYDPREHGSEKADRADHLDEVRAALHADQLVVHYQPKVHLGSDSVSGVEALVRWQHPTRGVLLPAEFLPAVEELGLMPALTTTVLAQALAQAEAWRREGLPLAVSVNLTAAEVVDSSLPDRVAAVLAEHDLPPSSLQLEITEETLLHDRYRARQVLGRLRDMGIVISIDDYGSGYSSLAYLRELTVDELKLDRVFVQPMATDARAAAIVRSTIDLAHSLGLNIVAEGVEEAEAAGDLLRYGCDVAQGFHYSQALPAEELTEWFLARGELGELLVAGTPDAQETRLAG